MRRSGKLHLRVDPRSVSMAAALRATAEASPLLVVTQHALADLADELGSFDAAVRELLTVAGAVGRPVAVNLPTGPEASTTVFIAPRSWTSERLLGWAAGQRELLAQRFGEVAGIHDLSQTKEGKRCSK